MVLMGRCLFIQNCIFITKRELRPIALEGGKTGEYLRTEGNHGEVAEEEDGDKEGGRAQREEA
jgi:hypothetical protein